MDEYAVDFLHDCVRTETFRFGDFTLKSKRPSRYFFNLGTEMNDGKGVSAASEAYMAQLLEKLEFTKRYDPEKVFLFGPAYKGIALAGVVALNLFDMDINVRWGYDRKEIKDHGGDANKWLVGDLRDGDTVIIMDDVITTAGTKREAWANLSKARKGLKHGGIVVALDRQETDLDGSSPVPALEKEGIAVSSILKAREVFDYLHNKEIEGDVLVDNAAYEAFQEHQRKFGAKG